MTTGYFNYTPARLVRGVRWYVEFYQTDPITNEKKRFREYLQLNRIKDKNERLRRGFHEVNHLNQSLLPYGYPFVDTSNMPDNITISEGLKMALSVKSRSDRKKTVGSYNTVVNHFSGFLKKRGWETMPFRKFGVHEANEYMDVILLEKRVKARTYNNYRLFLIAIWNELISRGYSTLNPFTKLKKMKETDKERRMFDHMEANTILKHCLETDRMMALSILLLHYCFIRPGEQRQLRVSHINLLDGVITIPGYISKNKRTQKVTIPDGINKILGDLGLNEWNRNYYIFGKGLMPHPDTMCGSNALAGRHKSIVKSLVAKRKLHATTGMTLYSWKDTGAMEMIRSGVDAYQVMRQMRHSDLSTTQKYLNALHQVNQSVRDLSITLCLQSYHENGKH